MSYTESLTQTYTIADIGKVIDCFAADLDMTSQSTGLLTRDLVKQYAADVKAMAQQGYLLEANIVLEGCRGHHDQGRQVRSFHRRRESHRQPSRQQSLAGDAGRRAEHCCAEQPEVARSHRSPEGSIQQDAKHVLDGIEHRPVFSRL